MEVKFACKSCGKVTGNEIAKYSEFEYYGYEEAVNFIDFEDSKTIYSDNLPKLNDRRIIAVKHPFCESFDREFWTLYQPGYSKLNGWDEYPEEIDRSAFVKCKLSEIIDRKSDLGMLLQAVVTEVIMLNEAPNIIVPKKEKSSLLEKIVYYDFKLNRINTINNWQFYEGSVEGDLGYWMLIKIIHDLPHLIAYGEWTFHQDAAYLGNIILSKDTYQTILARC